MGITSLFHLIVFTHHIMSFQSSEMSVVFTKNKGGNGREREGWRPSQEASGKTRAGRLPGSSSFWVLTWGRWRAMPWPVRTGCLLRLELDGREALWINLGFRDLQLALGTSGFPSPVKVWCRKKLNEPYCKDFALKQKIFNTLGPCCWECSFPSVALRVNAQGFGNTRGFPAYSPARG